MAAETGDGRLNARLLVVGGQSRNVGKTALVVDLIRAFPEAAWTAVKITQYGQGICAVNGDSCNCAPRDHAVALDVEADSGGRTDTSRMLAAGAHRALWLRTKQGRLAEGLPLLRSELARNRFGTPGNLIVESNSLLGFLSPRLYLAVLDPAVADFKDSARRFLDRADAFVFRRAPEEGWPELAFGRLSNTPAFVQKMGERLPAALRQMVRHRFLGNGLSANG